jgi:tRNA-modifying protein YgfZ
MANSVRTELRRTLLLTMPYYLMPSSGTLRIGGDDRVAFLQRQTTNDLNLVRPEHAVLTVLTTPAARILDVLYVLPEEAALWVITLPGHGESTRRYLQSRIFFMDKVTVADASAELAQVDLLGPEAPMILERLGIDPQLGPDQVTVGVFEGARVHALRLEPSFGMGVRLLLPRTVLPVLQTLIVQAGVAQLSDEEYSLLRIEAGLPAGGAELSEDYTPLEVGLAAAISSTKGCYTGQEVLARQVTYDKVTQNLCGLKLSRRALSGERVWAPDGSPAGRVTSAANSPRFGEIALAVIKRPHHTPDSELQVGESVESAASGRVTELPFHTD